MSERGKYKREPHLDVTLENLAKRKTEGGKRVKGRRKRVEGVIDHCVFPLLCHHVLLCLKIGRLEISVSLKGGGRTKNEIRNKYQKGEEIKLLLCMHVEVEI